MGEWRRFGPRWWAILPPRVVVKYLAPFAAVSIVVLWLLWHFDSGWFAVLMTLVYLNALVLEIKGGPEIKLNDEHVILVPDFTTDFSPTKSGFPPVSPRPPDPE